MAQQPNIYRQSANAYTTALQNTRGLLGYKPQQINAGQFGYDPRMVSAQTAVGGIDQYMNPYTQQVIDRSMQDLQRQRQTTLNDVGAQATAAKAFGGSRHGVAEAQTNEAFAQQAADTSAQMRQQGFQTALGASQQDVANRMLADQANQGAYNAAQQFGQNLSIQAQQANQNAGLQGAQFRLGAANQMGQLSNLGFGMGQQINAQQLAQGNQQQQLQQQLYDLARMQYQGFAQQPYNAFNVYQNMLGTAAGNAGSTTTSGGGFGSQLGGALEGGLTVWDAFKGANR